MSLIYDALEKADNEKKAAQSTASVTSGRPQRAPESVPPWGMPIVKLIFISLGIFMGISLIFHNPVALKYFYDRFSENEKTQNKVKPEAPLLKAALPVNEEQQKIDFSILKLSGIISDSDSSLAIINGKVFKAGDVVTGDIKVKRIEKETVVVESGGKEFTLEK